jgi:LysM repeat protein
MLTNQEWSKRSRFLTQALILSGALNIALLATFVYFVMREKEEAVAFHNPPPAKSEILVSELSNEALLGKYALLPFAELIALLENTEVVEAGYKKQDLALASLAAFHFFNLEKAVGSSILQRRQISLINPDGQEKIELTIFPGLTEEQYLGIQKYVATERWPVTTEGLFFEVKQRPHPRDPALLEAFYLTEEFLAVATLFSRVGLNVNKEFLTELVAQGDFSLLSKFTEEQKLAQDLTPSRLRLLLLQYVKQRSELAARILLESDRDFMARRLEDRELLLFLDLLTEPTSSLKQFLQEILQTPRSDVVWNKAREKLQVFGVLPLQATQEKKKPASKSRRYVVQERDSLWKIAQKHKVTVEALIEKNHLENTKLRPGRELEIPE